MKHAPALSDHGADIQGMLKSGFGWLKASRFWLLTIREGREDQARAWLGYLADSGLIVSARDAKRGRKIDEAVAVAFSFAGLQTLGCREDEMHPFPTPFSSGMGSPVRRQLLRDTPREQWRWSDGASHGQIVHVLVAQWMSDREPPRMVEPDLDAFVVTRVENNPCSFGADGNLYEPFRFRDGLAQPVIRGLREEQGAALKQAKQDAGQFYQDRVVEPGEFILGYRNEYDELTYCPNVAGWTDASGRFTLNGSYLAVRQIEQKVELFEKFEADNKAFRGANGVTASEMLMGRRRNGHPLSWKGPPTAVISDSKADAFRYRVEDANGFMCPKGAHVRRANPRDTLGIDVPSSIKSSKLHRLLRRGRPYREASGSQGIFFIACNADLERQFEFIHQRWVQNPRFGTFANQDDPIVGSQSCPKTFTIPGTPSGSEVSLQHFTTTLGGGYFFLPGLKALRFIVRNRTRTEARPQQNAEALTP